MVAPWATWRRGTASDVPPPRPSSPPVAATAAVPRHPRPMAVGAQPLPKRARQGWWPLPPRHAGPPATHTAWPAPHVVPPRVVPPQVPGDGWDAGGLHAIDPARRPPAEPRPTHRPHVPQQPRHPPTLRAKAAAATGRAEELAVEARRAAAVGLHGAAAATADAAAAAKACASRAHTAAGRARPSLAAVLEPMPRPAGPVRPRGPVPEGSRANYQVGGGVTVPKPWKGGGWRAKCQKLIELVLAEDWQTAAELASEYKAQMEGGAAGDDGVGGGASSSVA